MLTNIFRELRLELTVAQWDLTYPAFFPSPPNGLQSQSQGETVWYFYLAEIALRRLENRILNFLYQYESAQTSYANTVETILHFEQQADGWSLKFHFHLRHLN